MAANSRRLWPYLSAGVLALLTLGVFFVLQDYGPESAIRRFHVAALRADPVEIQRVTEQSIRNENTIRLASQVRWFLRPGVTYQVMRMQRAPSHVRAAVVYKAGRQQFPMIWVVEKKGRVWKVNADKTATIMRDSLGIGFAGP